MFDEDKDLLNAMRITGSLFIPGVAPVSLLFTMFSSNGMTHIPRDSSGVLFCVMLVAIFFAFVMLGLIHPFLITTFFELSWVEAVYTSVAIYSITVVLQFAYAIVYREYLLDFAMIGLVFSIGAMIAIGIAS